MRGVDVEFFRTGEDEKPSAPQLYYLQHICPPSFFLSPPISSFYFVHIYIPS